MESFSIKRFANLFKKHTAEHYKGYLMSLIVLIGILAFFLGIPSIIMKHLVGARQQYGTFFTVFLLAGTIFTSTTFAELGDNKKAIALLTTPATHIEKFFVKWLYSYLIFQILFVGSFYLVLIILQDIFRNAGYNKELLNIFHYPEMSAVFIGYAAFHAVALWGSVFFKKLHFIKTGFIFLIFYALVLFGNRAIMDALLGRDVFEMIPFFNVSIMENKKYIDIYVIGERHNQFILAMVFVTVAFWAAAYYRLKEKQV